MASCLRSPPLANLGRRNAELGRARPDSCYPVLGQGTFFTFLSLSLHVFSGNSRRVIYLLCALLAYPKSFRKHTSSALFRYHRSYEESHCSAGILMKTSPNHVHMLMAKATFVGRVATPYQCKRFNQTGIICGDVGQASCRKEPHKRFADVRC